MLQPNSPLPHSPGPGHYALHKAFGESVPCARHGKSFDSSVCLVNRVPSHSVPCLSSRSISDVSLCLHSVLEGILWCISTTPAPSPGSFRKFWLCILPCHPHPQPLDAVAPFPPLPKCTRQVGCLSYLDKADKKAPLWSLSEPCVLMSGQSPSGEQAAILQYPPGTMLATWSCVSCSPSEMIFKPVVPLITS